MITIRKLQSLPSSTRRRKTVRLFESIVEQRSVVDDAYLQGLLGIVESDAGLPADLRAAAARAAAAHAAAARTADAPELLRAVDRVRHLLLAALGMEPADWDLLAPAGLRSSDSSAADAATPADAAVLKAVSIYLESIRSPFNLGSIIRTAVAFGVRTIGMSDDCPPVDHRRVLRSAMGADVHARLLRGSLDDLFDAIAGSADGRSADEHQPPCIALELAGESVEVFEFPVAGVLLLGSEELGLSPEMLARAEHRVTIPMDGPKASVNVGVACGVALSAWRGAIR